MRVALVVIALLLASTSFADDDDAYKIIVNPNNPVDSVDRDFIRNGYLKKATEWKSGETIHPVDLSTSFPARGRFTQQVIRKTPTQLRNFWNQQIFSGK